MSSSTLVKNKNYICVFKNSIVDLGFHFLKRYVKFLFSSNTHFKNKKKAIL